MTPPPYPRAAPSQNPSELDVSAVTGLDDTNSYEPARKGLSGIVGKLFRLPWLGSEPADHDRGRELRRAVRAEDVSRVRKMLHEGVGVNESQEASLACIATRRRNLELLRLLIQAKVNLDQGDRRNRASRTRTPLQEAARKGWIEGLDAMVAAGAAVDHADDSGATALLLAVRAGQPAAVRRLLEAGAHPEGNPQARMAPIHEATSPDVAQMLLAYGADINAQDKSGASALHHQARAGRAQMVDFLLAHGAHANALDARGRSALFMLGAKGDVMGVSQKLWAAGVDPATRDQDQNTFAHLAATRCINPRVLEWLYEKAPALWSLKNNSGETPTDLLAARDFKPLMLRIRAQKERDDRQDEVVEAKLHSIFPAEADARR